MVNCKYCNAEIAPSAKTCPICGAKNKKPIWKRAWVWVLVVIALFIIIGSTSGNPSNKNVNFNNGDIAIAETKPATNEIDGYICEIVSAEIGGINYEGKPTVVITYKYTNNSNKARSFGIAFTDTVFQNGVECSPDYVYDVNEDNYLKEIRPGASIEVKRSYILNDIISDVEVEIVGLFTFDNTVIAKTFTITN